MQGANTGASAFSFAGVFGSSGPGLGVATISDLYVPSRFSDLSYDAELLRCRFAPRERGRVLSIYAIVSCARQAYLSAERFASNLTLPSDSGTYAWTDWGQYPRIIPRLARMALDIAGIDDFGWLQYACYRTLHGRDIR